MDLIRNNEFCQPKQWVCYSFNPFASSSRLHKQNQKSRDRDKDFRPQHCTGHLSSWQQVQSRLFAVLRLLLAPIVMASWRRANRSRELIPGFGGSDVIIISRFQVCHKVAKSHRELCFLDVIFSDANCPPNPARHKYSSILPLPMSCTSYFWKQIKVMCHWTLIFHTPH